MIGEGTTNNSDHGSTDTTCEPQHNVDHGDTSSVNHSNNEIDHQSSHNPKNCDKLMDILNDSKLTQNCGWALDKLAPFWDLHFFLPVYEWQLNKAKANGNRQEIEIVEKVYLDVLSKTAMFKKAESVCSEIDRPIPNVITDRLALFKEEINNLMPPVIAFIKALLSYKREQRSRLSGFSEKKTVNEISEWWLSQKVQRPNVKDHDSESTTAEQNYTTFYAGVENDLIRLAKLLYECGNYLITKKLLEFYLDFVVEYTYEGLNQQKKQSCCWGLTSCIIMNSIYDSRSDDSVTPFIDELMKIDFALKDNDDDDDKDGALNSGLESASNHLLNINVLIEAGEDRFDRNKIILLRGWLLHWILFPFFKFNNFRVDNTKGWIFLPEWLLEEKSIAVTLLIAPHLLRYFAVYAILNRKRKDHFQTVLNAINAAKCKYSDSFTYLIESLFVYSNFDAAQKYMAEIAMTCENDYFLWSLKSIVEENCRLLIFETYCRIHRSINIDMIAKKVNMHPEAAEKWIVNLMRHAKLEAKIDSESNRVEMSSNQLSLYQQVVERTVNIGIRTSMLYQNLCRLMVHGKGGDGMHDYDNKGSHMNRQDGFKYKSRNRNWGGNRGDNNKGNVRMTHQA